MVSEWGEFLPGSFMEEPEPEPVHNILAAHFHSRGLSGGAHGARRGDDPGPHPGLSGHPGQGSDRLRGVNSREQALWTLTLGIAVLILTPYLRVLLSVFYFLWEKDFKFSFITFFVFLILTLSLAAR